MEANERPSPCRCPRSRCGRKAWQKSAVIPATRLPRRCRECGSERYKQRSIWSWTDDPHAPDDKEGGLRVRVRATFLP